MTCGEKERFWVRTPAGDVIARFSRRRFAIDRARQEARKSGHEIEVFDALAQIAAIETWSVSPSGVVQANEIRSVESEKRDLQDGVEG